MSKLLEVKNLKTSFKTHIGDVQSVRGVSFHLNKGEALGVVGESGCGKSVTMMTIMRLLGENAKIEAETKLLSRSIDENVVKKKRSNYYENINSCKKITKVTWTVIFR